MHSEEEVKVPTDESQGEEAPIEQPPVEEEKSVEPSIEPSEGDEAEEGEKLPPESEVVGEEPKEWKEEEPPQLVDHEVTQEDLDENPGLGEAGVKVGDVIQIEVPKALAEELQKEEGVEPTQPPLEETPEMPLPKEEEEVSQPAPAQGIDKPVWVDERIWVSLSEERRHRLVNGQEWR